MQKRGRKIKRSVFQIRQNKKTVPQWTITSTGKYNNATKTLEFGCREAALSQWVYNTGSEWCPQWNGPGYWITGDTFRGGPVNTNGRFYVSGSPTFYGPATQHDPNVGYLNPGTDSPNWLGGLTTGTPIITIDTTVATGIINIASAIIPPATSAGDKDIELVSDGTILITPYDTNGNKLPPAVLFVPNATKPMIYVPGSTAKVTVHGTLKGQLTIVSDSDIIVTSDILYHDFGPSVPPTIPGTGGTTIPNPNYNAASTDLLGLVSNKNVMIAAAGNPTVDGQVVARCIEIDASIMTPNGCVWVEDYGSTPHGVLTTFGGMTSATGGGTGTFSGNTMIYGYHVDMRYDPRLALLVPPGFASATDSTSRVIYTKTSFNEPFGS